MNEPFISPWLIYLVQALSEIKTTIFFVCGIGLPTSAIGAFLVYMLSDTADDPELFSGYMKWFKRFAWVSFSLFVMQAVLPSSKTATAMLISSKATPANYDAIKQEILTLVGEIKKTEE